MSNILIQANDFPDTKALLQAVSAGFENSAGAVVVVDGSRIVGTMLSPIAAQKALARQVAEHWIANPDMLQELSASLVEEPEEWR